jgi:hypothetical protein
MLQQHPAYHEGFYDAQDGEPIFDDCPSLEYRAGWIAFWRCRSLVLAEPALAREASLLEYFAGTVS